MMEYSITLPLYVHKNKKDVVLVGMNWYRNSNPFLEKKIKTFYEGLIKEDLEGEPKLNGHLHVHYKIYIKRKGTDGGNIRSIIEKYALDGFKSAGIIEDDNFEIIVTDSAEYHLDKEYPRAVVTISEKENNNNNQLNLF